jgi:predicted dehydrogenase
VKEWLAEGRIGKIRYMHINFGFQAQYDESNRLFNFAVGGGALLDAGVYPITYAIHVLGKLPKEADQDRGPERRYRADRQWPAGWREGEPHQT